MIAAAGKVNLPLLVVSVKCNRPCVSCSPVSIDVGTNFAAENFQ